MSRRLRDFLSDRILPLARHLFWTLADDLPRSVASRLRPAESSARHHIVAANGYGLYCVPVSSRHRPAARAILASRVWEPETIRLLRERCGTGDVVHAGTYFGDFLPAVSSALSPGAILWAFEPNPENHRCALGTVRLNNLANVVLTNAGLGESEERLPLRTHDAYGRPLGGASRIIAARAGLGDAPTVRMVTVDATVGPDRFVSVIQLDVEGHEKEALSGALGTIRRCRPIIVLEASADGPLCRGDWFAANILALGYAKTGEVHVNSVFTCRRAAGSR